MSEEAGKTIYTCEAFRNSSYIIGIVQMIMLPIYSKTFFKIAISQTGPFSPKQEGNWYRKVTIWHSSFLHMWFFKEQSINRTSEDLFKRGRKRGNEFWEILVFFFLCQCNSALWFSMYHSHLKACVLRFYSFYQMPRQSTITVFKLALDRLAVVQMLAEALAQTQNAIFFFIFSQTQFNSIPDYMPSVK